MFQTFRPLVVNFFKTKIISLYTDGGSEYKNVQSYLQQNGIEDSVSSTYTPQRVAIAERRHRHIVEIAKTLLHEASLLPDLWSFAFHDVVYLINRLPTPILHNVSPFQQLFGKLPNYANLKIFGCLCFHGLIPIPKISWSLSPPLVCIYVFHQAIMHTFALTQYWSKIFISPDVLFYEFFFLLKQCFYR